MGALYEIEKFCELSRDVKYNYNLKVPFRVVGRETRVKAACRAALQQAKDAKQNFQRRKPCRVFFFLSLV